jgi:hypothetical protein
VAQIDPYMCRGLSQKNFTIMKAGWASGLART